MNNNHEKIGNVFQGKTPVESAPLDVSTKQESGSCISPQNILDNAVFLRNLFANLVQVKVEPDGGVLYKIGTQGQGDKPKENVIFDASLPIVPDTNRKRETAPKKPQKQGKTHDLTEFTGFYKGRYYDHGVARPPKNDNGHNNGKNGKREK